MRLLGFTLALPLAAASWQTVFDDEPSPDIATSLFSDFDWGGLEPSTDLEYHDCYNAEYKCARLELPLDWGNETDPRTVSIAIMKLPAVVSDDDPSFAGSIFTNPGGPGHSGVTFVPRIGHLLQKKLDKPGERHYEIISFDPRGIGYSKPNADCFQGNTLARKGASVEARGSLGLDGGLESLLYNHAIHQANGQRCQGAEDSGNPIFEHISTPNVVRDMVEMLDRIEEEREREAAKKGQSWLELRKRSGSDDTARLQYVGFSYGTLLGNYFASMYPGRVHRMILDSVCDAPDYATGPGWLTGIQDMDATFDQFFKGCFEAGPGVCALTREDDRVWTDVAARTWKHLAELDEIPRGALGLNGFNVVLKGRDFRDFIGNSMYHPVKTFKPLAKLLNESIHGNAEPFVKVMSLLEMVPNLGAACPADLNNTQSTSDGFDSVTAVICGDGDDVTDKDTTWWRRYVDQLTSLSRVWGATWAEIRFPCSSWPFKNNWTFKGPFTTPKHDPALVEGKPSAPILFLANRFDPVTPTTAARAMTLAHPGAQLVVKESMGHGVLPGPESPCTDKIVAEYFRTGNVPDEETVCESECGPWDDICETYSADGKSRSFSAEYLEPAFGKFPLAV